MTVNGQVSRDDSLGQPMRSNGHTFRHNFANNPTCSFVLPLRAIGLQREGWNQGWRSSSSSVLTDNLSV